MEHFPTLTGTVAALHAGEVTSEQLTLRALDRIDALNEHLGAFVHVAREDALTAARAADARREDLLRRGGTTLPALLGVPTALKDGHDVAGMPTTWGSLTSLDETGRVPPAERSDELAATLQESGAVVLGKTQVPEFLLNSYSENRMLPAARNPFALDCSPGGSSGGQAAAVAAGILPGAIGSDGGGSIRIPAAACGLIGLKPNRGRVPSSDAMSNIGQLAVNGPLARTAEDAALLMDVLCRTPGHERIHRPVTAVAEPSFQESVRRALAGDPPWDGRPLRIGVSTASPFDETHEITVSPEARAALDAGVRQLTALGHTVENAQLHYDPAYPEAFSRLWTTAVGQLPLEGREPLLTGLARTFRERALARGAVELADAFAVLRGIEADLLRQFSRFDMVLTPALAMPPRPVGWFHEGFDIADPAGADQDYTRQCQYTPWTSVVNVAGLPAVTVPTTWVTPGPGDYPGPVPMGVQLIGAPSAEAALLALAAQLDPPTTPHARLVA
ncbi:amidase [Kocuria sp.]|uniref:amidase n=1 Tax=Kocuria sp. TaxID=1871328 RepID=UPI0026DB6AB4|nr:amidase [Kocuria sp.]MDO4919183.1 amidase [Kocuria sp.]